MSKLSPNDKEEIIGSLNGDTEPSPDLFPKLFPTLAKQIQEKGSMDVGALASSAVPTLEYAGKRTKAQILAQAVAGIGSAPLQIDRSFGCTEDRCTNPDEWTNLIVQGDNLQFLKTCYQNTDPLIKDKVKGKVKLIYIDPPFGTGDEYGGSGGERSYSAKLAGAEFIEANRERLIFLQQILAPEGIVAVRMDYHLGHYIKLVLDEVFGNDVFINELVVNRGSQRLGGKNMYSTATDSVYLYGASRNYTFSAYTRPRYSGEATRTNMLMKGERNPPQRVFLDPDGERVTLLPPPGQHWKFIQPKIDAMYEKGVIYLAESRKGNSSGIRKMVGDSLIGVSYVPSFMFDTEKTIDSNWTDIPGYAQTMNYPTENSEELLERIVLTGTQNPGDIVMDVFAGSGTTGAVAEKLGRKWIMADFGKHAIYTQQKRLLNIADSKALEEQKDKKGDVTVKKGDKYAKAPQPFCILSSGAYDFRGIINLGSKPEHKEAYIKFVMALFNLAPDEAAATKFNLVNITGEKDGDPVEVFPIWKPEYLTGIKIDQSYLQGVLDQSGGKFKGPYHIIAPETCANVGDTTIGEAKFIIHTFPFKMLDDINRQFVLHPQPASQASVNELITSTAYYFKDEISITVVKTATGLKITDFKTPILDEKGNKFENFAGLAMLLVDNDYDPAKPFDMDHALFAEDMEDDGSFELSDLSDSVAVIAIDRHGNETKAGKVK